LAAVVAHILHIPRHGLEKAAVPAAAVCTVQQREVLAPAAQVLLDKEMLEVMLTLPEALAVVAAAAAQVRQQQTQQLQVAA
jgi:hypothetical protein